MLVAIMPDQHGLARNPNRRHPTILTMIKPMMSDKHIVSCVLLSFAILSVAAKDSSMEPLVIAKQGSFTAGGTVVSAPGTFDPIAHGAFNPSAQSTAGQTLRGDHTYVFYQEPVGARPLPLVMWHGHGQSGKTWESTPDGREGFQTLFLRRKFPVYVIDQPRRGRAARSTEAGSIPADPDEQLWFGIFRMGVWPEFYPGIQFARDAGSLDQFFRQMLPNTGPFNLAVNVAAVSALFDRIGAAILVTHSHSGGMGWRTAMINPKVRAIVSFEPGSNFVFPTGEVPEPQKHVAGATAGVEVPLEEFMALTRIPILIYYGDFIPEVPSENPGQDQWRANLAMARLWQESVNRHGGDATVVHLPEEGIHGNTHFPMSDLNNEIIAAHMAAWLSAKDLD